jgi:prepilin-type N-terminal cleavage/methylation domain-containing protein
MTKRFGFTLAEVLITLGIIGVVAAMTIPTLIANTNGAKFRSQFKKTLSTLNQAGLMSQAQYDFDYAGAGTCSSTKNDAAKEDPTSSLTFCALFNGTLTGQTYIGSLSGLNLTSTTSGSADTYLSKVTLTSSGMPAMADYYAYTLADGSLIAFNKTAANCTLALGGVVNNATLKAASSDSANDAGGLHNCLGFIDVNGATLPNKEVSCSSGTTSLTPETPCTVANDASHMTDIFPVVFHDATVEPASNAAKYVLTTSK